MGARPNFMKVAPLIRYFNRNKNRFPNLSLVTVHTGQHSDEAMSESFLRQLEIGPLDHRFQIDGKTHAEQTAEIMLQFEKICLQHLPKMTVVVGDVNSTLACTLVAKKLAIAVAHIEAGLRSHNRTMPEEINRLATDAISDLFLTPSMDANENLLREGVRKERIVLVGNLMIDSLKFHTEELKRNTATNEKRPEYALLTLHRPANVDNRHTLTELLETLKNISNLIPIRFPCHPRTRSRIQAFGLTGLFDKQFLITDPTDYFGMLELYSNCKLVLTDSGGVQEETTALGIPCLTLREETERPITVQIGTNTIVGTNGSKIRQHVDAILSGNYKKGRIPDNWDGKAAERTWNAIEHYLGARTDDPHQILKMSTN